MSDPFNEARLIRPGEELDLERLGAYVREHLPGAAGPLEVEQFPGGHSNLTYLLRLGSHEMVLRRPPFGNRVKTAHDMGREYHVLSRLHKVYEPAPRPIAYCEDDRVLGAPFYLMERRRGFILRDNAPPASLKFDPATVRRLCESFIDNLALLHGVDYRAAGLADLGRPAGYVARQVEGWTKRYYNVQTEELADIDQIARWLAERLPAESGAALIHNDYKYDNIMLDPQDLTRIIAVLDWEMCTVGDPLMDFGTALAYWIEPTDREKLHFRGQSPTLLPGSMTRSELVERYGAKSGREVSKMLYYYCFGLFKTAVILQQIYYRYVKGHTQDERFARLNQSVALLGRVAVRAAEAGRF